MDFDILIAGDFYVGPHAGGRLGPLVEKNDIQNLFGELLEPLQKSQLSILNLESPIIKQNSPAKKTGPVLSMSPNIVEVLSEVNIDLVCLANNHIMDHGQKGLESTLHILEEENINSVGAGTTENQKRNFFITDVNGKKVGIINVCENEWITSHNGEAGANGLDEVHMFNQINALKSTADFIIVIFHGGNEYYALPSPRVKRILRYFIDVGADVVVGHHTHTYSGYELYNNKPIYYSLGNFIFDSQRKSKGKNWHTGMAVGFNIVNNTITSTIVPFKQHDGRIGVEILKNDALKLFSKELENLNVIIQDDQLLGQAYKEFAENMTQQYDAFLNPYEGKLASLFKKGLLPNVFSVKKKRLLLNLIRCESHRDVLEIILKLKLNN